MSGDGDGLRGALPIEDGARLLGAHVWAERQLFEVVGGFAADEQVPAAAVFFDTRGAHHAWHATLLAELLPVVPGLDHGALTAAPSGAGATLEVLAGRRGTLARLAGLVRVVWPRLVEGYRAHLALAAPVADAPLARVLRLVVFDEEDALAEGEALLGRLGAVDPDGLAEALRGTAELEAPLAGTAPGLAAWPDRNP